MSHTLAALRRAYLGIWNELRQLAAETLFGWSLKVAAKPEELGFIKMLAEAQNLAKELAAREATSRSNSQSWSIDR